VHGGRARRARRGPKAGKIIFKKGESEDKAMHERESERHPGIHTGGVVIDRCSQHAGDREGAGQPVPGERRQDHHRINGKWRTPPGGGTKSPPTCKMARRRWPAPLSKNASGMPLSELLGKRCAKDRRLKLTQPTLVVKRRSENRKRLRRTAASPVPTNAASE